MTSWNVLLAPNYSKGGFTRVQQNLMDSNNLSIDKILVGYPARNLSIDKILAGYPSKRLSIDKKAVLLDPSNEFYFVGRNRLVGSSKSYRSGQLIFA